MLLKELTAYLCEGPLGLVRGVDEHDLVRILLDHFPEHLLVGVIQIFDGDHVADDSQASAQQSVDITPMLG